MTTEQQLRELLEKNDDVMIYYNGYVEPGYDDPESGMIATANWNDVDPEPFEELGIEIEWSDEWSDCCNCGKLFRTSPDSYSWTPYYAWIGECEMICGDCIKDDPSDYLEELNGNKRKCETIGISLEEHGYRLYQDGYENGFHPGQNDDPQAIAKQLREKGFKNFIFQLDSTGQFDMNFSVWVLDEVQQWIDKTANEFMVPEMQFFTDNEAKEYVGEDATGGIYARLSAPGYLDCTDWIGPFDSQREAEEELYRMYGND